MKEIFFFRAQDYIKELETELKMRRKVWKRTMTKPTVFLNDENQRRYEVLNELHLLLIKLGPNRMKLLHEKLRKEHSEQGRLDV